MRELLGTLIEQQETYSADDVERATGTAVTPPDGEYFIRDIDIKDTDLYKKNLLTIDAFGEDNYDNYHAERLEYMKKGIGNLPPIIALPNNDGYEVIDGHHRLILYKEEGIDKVKAFVFTGGKE